MRTQTIFEAYQQLEFMNGVEWAERDDNLPPRQARQLKTFRDELSRRMDHYDTLVVPPPPAFASVEGIERYMAGLSEDMKADDILRGGK